MSNLGGNSPSEETDRSNNLQGEKGDTGDVGEQGETGDTGATGDTGDTGDTGAAGTNGTDGEDGIGNTVLEIGGFAAGAPVDAAKILTMIVSTAFDLPSGLTDSEAYAEVVATANATIDIKKNGSSVGSINFALGANVATFTFATLTAFVAGDRLQLVAQSTADDTLADIAFTLKGDL